MDQDICQTLDHIDSDSEEKNWDSYDADEVCIAWNLHKAMISHAEYGRL